METLLELKAEILKEKQNIENGFKTVKHFHKVKKKTLEIIKQSISDTKAIMKTVELNKNIDPVLASEIQQLALANIKQYRLLYAKVR